ncbi:hypothetical protein FQN49_001494 [Arthroderma sp. PD_2]|nr:hypothetical protein FQN49_001494 [Arthroderma sp. PD_2]
MAAPIAGGGASEGSQALPDDESIAREYDLLSSYTETTDYYSLLTLSRDPPPTDAAIRSAYRALTLSFHPDKQPSHLQEAARAHFGKIQTAYETLIDPKKRVVYDMLGEEGVKREWGLGGLLGKFGEGQRTEVGVKAMNEAQFRRWFVRKMKDKEHSVLEDLIRSRIHMEVGLDAKNMFSKETEDSITIQVPDVKPSTFSLGIGFKTPIPSIPGFGSSNSKDEDDDGDNNSDGMGLEDEDEGPQLQIQASAGGRLHRLKRVITLVDEETNEETEVEQEIPHTLITGQLSLAATVEHFVQDTGTQGPSLNRLLFPFLGDSHVKVGATLFPTPAFTIFLRKTVVPISGTRPFHVSVNTVSNHSPLDVPPSLNVLVQRQLGARKVMYGNWSSGLLTWPSFIAPFFESISRAFYSADRISIIAPEHSHFELGYSIIPKEDTKGKQPSPGSDYTDEEEEMAEHFRGAHARLESRSREAWAFFLHASPASIQLTVNHGRNLFTSEPEQPAVSQWNYEGYTPRKVVVNSPPIRLEIAATVSLDLSTGWSITGTRKFGGFTKMGLGIGVEGGKGLVCSITWSRLGQKLSLPIAICPFEALDADIASLAVIVPWLTYSIMEFGYWRPRQRRKQKKEIARQQRRVQRLIAKRRANSLEAIALMREQVNRRQDIEEQRGGLVILHAEYGHISPPSSFRLGRDDSRARENMVDVTIPVAALVDQGQLNIPSSVVKGEILGFSDPCPFLSKTLRIEYVFGWKKHLVEIVDGEAVTCPMRSHLV